MIVMYFILFLNIKFILLIQMFSIAMLRAMFSGRMEVLTDSEGKYVITEPQLSYKPLFFS